ncbi:MAG: hypothetical protein RL701_4772 [Pseudomonadota bacterium]|jgi:Ca2+-transporting ATPase
MKTTASIRDRSIEPVGPADQAPPAYTLSPNIVLNALTSDRECGLSENEAQARLRRYGNNELLAEQRIPGWKRLLAQFKSVLVILLLVAAGVSTATWLSERDTPLPYEALAIIAVVLFNAALGYIQEARAESAVSALQQLTAAKCQVVRDGVRRSIAAQLLVPGDLLLVEAGDAIAADARLLECTALQTAEAALTGESVPVTKSAEALTAPLGLGDQVNMLFGGTVVTYGRGRAVVTMTGMRTQMGRIAGMLRGVVEDSTPLQKQLDRVGKLLGVTVVAIAVVVLTTIVVTEGVDSFDSLSALLVFGIALAVAAVPEGLPAVVTAVLAVGVQRMARRNAIVRHLSAVETLGAADVIASDKTGTLTKNEMTVRAISTASGSVSVEGTGYAPIGDFHDQTGEALDAAQRNELDEVLRVACLANNASVAQDADRWTVQGDPTEGALIVAARKWGIDPRELAQQQPRIAEVPFSSERKRMSTVHRDITDAANVLICTKGAPDVLLELCAYELRDTQLTPLTVDRRREIARHNDELGALGLRTLALARRELYGELASSDETVERDLVFLGLVGMFDPPRDEAKRAVAQAHTAGIRTLMITGDHPKTAGAVAAELGIARGARVITGRELETMSDAALAQTVKIVNVYARVDPAHKLRIVQELTRQGAIVAMTGDGVNDAPALKTAHIGVAMGITGSDVSKQAADMVLADDNFASIVAAVEEGRAIFANIRKFLRYLLSSNIGEVMTMFFGVLFAGPLGLHAENRHIILPVVATQLLWINLLTDGAPALALGLDPSDPAHMSYPPRKKNESVITRKMWAGIIFVGGLMAMLTLIALDASLPGGLIEGAGTITHAQTRAFTTLTLCQLFNVVNARSDERSAFEHIFTNSWLWIALGASLLMQLAVIYLEPLQHAFSTTPLTASDWLVCTTLASGVLWLRELDKLLRRHRARC